MKSRGSWKNFAACQKIFFQFFDGDKSQSKSNTFNPFIRQRNDLIVEQPNVSEIKLFKKCKELLSSE